MLKIPFLPQNYETKMLNLNGIKINISVVLIVELLIPADNKSKVGVVDTSIIESSCSEDIIVEEIRARRSIDGTALEDGVFSGK